VARMEKGGSSVTENLLQNGAFEADWAEEYSHRVRVFTEQRDGSFSGEEIAVGNVFTPPGWVAWARLEESKWHLPEVKDAWAHRRARSGAKGIMMFKTFGRFDAGFMQTVQVAPGTKLRFSVYGHAWSNHNGDGFPHPGDARWSEGTLVGFGENVCLEQADIPADNGESQNDANRNFRFTVGIDTTGGTNPYAESVAWGDPLYCYNGYSRPVEVEATARGNKVTVFIRAKVRWPFKINDAYWDDAELVQVGTVIVPPAGECENPAREPYDRTYVLLPPDATEQEALDAMREYFPKRRTIGFSADDAGIGCKLGERRVIVIRPNAWPGGEVALKDFYNTYYPDIVYDSGTTPSPELVLCQKNALWSGLRFGAATCKYTIGQMGCFITCLAMALRFYKKDAWATPATVNQALTANGYTVCRPYWTWIEDKLGLKLSSPTNVDEWLDKGYCAMAEVKPTTLEHFVLVVRREGTAYWMLDPIDGSEGWLDEAYDGVESWRLILPAETPPPGLNVVGLHWQKRVQNDIEYVQTVRPGIAKTVLNIEFCKEFKRVSPNTLTVFRQWRADQGEFINKTDGPRKWLETFLDSLLINANYVDFVESLNEMIATDDIDGIKRITEFDAQFCEELRKEGFPARPLVLNAAVGNPQHGEQVELMLPAVRAAIEADGALGYHSYWGSRPDGYCTMKDNFRHYAGRAMESWDPVFREHGLYPKYVFGEAGAVHISPDGWLNPNAGWKDACWNWDHYVEQILQFKSRIDIWNAQHNNRVLGFTIFTLGGGSQWATFDLNGYLDRLIEVFQ